MAKAGSGDVLAGVIAGLFAQGMDENLAAPMGAYIHGLAGDLWRRENGAYGLARQRVADCVGKVLKGWE